MDGFERNLEATQLSLDIPPSEHIPVLYRTVLEPSFLITSLPSLAFGLFLLLTLKRSRDLFGRKGGRKKGLFGSMMESTAKLINSNEIGVRFKYELMYPFLFN